MRILKTHAHARAGLVGNPSDGYNGKTISLIVRDFRAEIVLYEWDQIEIVSTQQDQTRFPSVHDLASDVRRNGYYGGIRLVKATIKRFVDYCVAQQIALHDRSFSIRYNSNIPRGVGLAGSSAIIVATLRALMAWYEVSIAEELLPSLALSVETRELGIPAGLQDRVIQVYEGLVFMDFAKMTQHAGMDVGRYERLDPKLLPPIYAAYSTEQAEPTFFFHNDIRGRFDRGEPAVLQAMSRCADLAAEARQALLGQNVATLHRCIDENFEQRRAIYKLPPGQARMIDVARSVGASANFAGSGGAIVGLYRDEAMYSALEKVLGSIHCSVIRPVFS